MKNLDFFYKAESIIEQCFANSNSSFSSILDEFSYYDLENSNTFLQIKLAYLKVAISNEFKEEYWGLEDLYLFDIDEYFEEMNYLSNEEESRIEELLYLDNYCKEKLVSTLTEIIERNEEHIKSNADADKIDWLIELPTHLNTQDEILGTGFKLISSSRYIASYCYKEFVWRDKLTKELNVKYIQVIEVSDENGWNWVIGSNDIMYEESHYDFFLDSFNVGFDDDDFTFETFPLIEEIPY